MYEFCENRSKAKTELMRLISAIKGFLDTAEITKPAIHYNKTFRESKAGVGAREEKRIYLDGCSTYLEYYA